MAAITFFVYLENNEGDAMKSKKTKNEKNPSGTDEKKTLSHKDTIPESPQGMSLEEFLDPGDVFSAGFSNVAIDELVDIARKISPSKPIRVVDEWTYLDIRCGSKISDMFEKEGVKPAMLMAHQIVYDSTQPSSVGHWVRTSLLQEFHKPGIFETRNRIDVMLNSGRRKTVLPEYINSIF